MNLLFSSIISISFFSSLKWSPLFSGFFLLFRMYSKRFKWFESQWLLSHVFDSFFCCLYVFFSISIFKPPFQRHTIFHFPILYDFENHLTLFVIWMFRMRRKNSIKVEFFFSLKLCELLHFDPCEWIAFVNKITNVPYVWNTKREKKTDDHNTIKTKTKWFVSNCSHFLIYDLQSC